MKVRIVVTLKPGVLDPQGKAIAGALHTEVTIQQLVGDAALLGREMAALGRRCRRVVWLNPMMAWEGYAPEAAGIKAALPHVDLYAPANTLQSLTALEPYLARL